MNDERMDVEARRFELELAEALGAEAPPDRTAAILARVASGPRRASAVKRVWLAAMLLLGAGTVVAVAWLRREPPADGRFAAAPERSAPERSAPELPVPGPDRDQGRGAVAAKPIGKPPTAVHAPGTSPQDLAAMQSAAAMLAAEQRLRELLAAGQVPALGRRLGFDELRGWSYRDGLEGAPASVLALDGAAVAMTGFMLPIDEVRGMRTFLLVESLWSCCFGVPPDVHGIVRCALPAGQTVDYTFDPVLVRGRFRVSATIDDGYCVDIFQLDADQVVTL